MVLADRNHSNGVRSAFEVRTDLWFSTGASHGSNAIVTYLPPIPKVGGFDLFC